MTAFPKYFRLESALDVASNKPIRILERSLFSERFCFVENQAQLEP
jgi:hypothetical protein